MKCYLVTMDFSLSAERRLWGKRKLIGTFTFLVLNSFFFFFLRTNFKNIVRQISRTSDNSWLEYCERVILFFSLHCWMVRFFLILSMWGVITDRFFNWVSWGHGFRDGGHSFHFNIDWVSTNKHMPHRGSCWTALSSH